MVFIPKKLRGLAWSQCLSSRFPENLWAVEGGFPENLFLCFPAQLSSMLASLSLGWSPHKGHEHLHTYPPNWATNGKKTPLYKQFLHVSQGRLSMDNSGHMPNHNQFHWPRWDHCCLQEPGWRSVPSKSHGLTAEECILQKKIRMEKNEKWMAARQKEWIPLVTAVTFMVWKLSFFFFF